MAQYYAYKYYEYLQSNYSAVHISIVTSIDNFINFVLPNIVNPRLIADKWLFKALKYRCNPKGDSHKHREVWGLHGGDVSDNV